MSHFLRFSKAPIALTLCLTLIAGCSKPKEPTTSSTPGAGTSTTTTATSPLSYFELTFDGKLVEMKDLAGSYDIKAIGTNGDKSLIYFATDGTINSYDSDTGTVDKQGPGKDYIKILPGLAGQVLLVHKKGIDVMDMTTVAGAALVVPPLHGDATSPAVSSSTWIAFASNDTGYHGDLAAPAISIAGPGSATGAVLGQEAGHYISASFFSGTDLYLAEMQVTRGMNIIKYSGALDKNIDFTQNIQLSDSDIDGYISTGNSGLIIALAVVGDYLIAGQDNSGIALLKLSDMKKTKPQSKDMGNVLSIAISSNNESALITTDKGLVFFYDGKLINIADEADTPNSYKRLESANLSATQPIAFTDINAKPADLVFTAGVTAGAVHVGDSWYVAGNQGVFKIKMEQRAR